MSLALLGGPPMRNCAYAPWPVYGDSEARRLVEVLESRHWGGLTVDSQLARFEQEFAAYHGVEHAFGVCNGTCALMLALRAAGIQPGDEVIVPAMSYIATATAVSLVGAFPVFIDVEPETHSLSLRHLMAAINDRTVAVVPVHLYGHPCPMEPLLELAARHNLRIVEDCSQAHGAQWRGRKVGTFGDVAAFSFAQNKNICSGEGGAVLTRDGALARAAMQLRDHGRLLGSTGVHLRLGWNFRLGEFQAGLLRCQLERLNEHLATKERTAGDLACQLMELGYPWIEPLLRRPDADRHGWFAFPMRYRKEEFRNISRESIRAALEAEGIPVSRRQYSLTYQSPIYQDPSCEDASPCRILECPHAEREKEMLILTGQAVGSAILLAPITEARHLVEAVVKIGKHRDDLWHYDRHVQRDQPV